MFKFQHRQLTNRQLERDKIKNRFLLPYFIQIEERTGEKFILEQMNRISSVYEISNNCDIGIFEKLEFIKNDWIVFTEFKNSKLIKIEYKRIETINYNLI